MFMTVISSSYIDCFINIRFSLSPERVFYLNPILSDICIATPALFWLLCALNIFVYLFAFTLCKDLDRSCSWISIQGWLVCVACKLLSQSRLGVCGELTPFREMRGWYFSRRVKIILIKHIARIYSSPPADTRWSHRAPFYGVKVLTRPAWKIPWQVVQDSSFGLHPTPDIRVKHSQNVLPCSTLLPGIPSKVNSL